MRRRISHITFLLGLSLRFATALIPSDSPATEVEEKHHTWLREIGIMTGYASAPLTEKKGDYEIIPLLPQFGFDISPLARKLNIKPKGEFSFEVEPLMNVVINPDANAEVGCSGVLKYSQKITSRIAPYIEGGVGMIYTTQHTHEQGTQYNFITQAGAGLKFFLTHNWALTGGYRFRHLSNAGLDGDNEGHRAASLGSVAGSASLGSFHPPYHSVVSRRRTGYRWALAAATR